MFCFRDCQQSSQTFIGCRLLTIDFTWPSHRSLAGASRVKTPLFTLQSLNNLLTLAKVLLLCRLTVLGGIKTGKKKLFIRTETGSFCELEPVCVLDFYVHEDYQRQGLGKHVFEVGFYVVFKSCS